MKYFKISQHKIIGNVAAMPDITESELGAKRGIVKQVDDLRDAAYLNFYEKPCPIVSSKFKDALRPYLPEAIGIPLFLTDKTSNSSVIYWLLKPEPVKNQYIEANAALVLKLDDIAGQKLFKASAGFKEHVIADLDITELILRNSISDICITEVQVI